MIFWGILLALLAAVLLLLCVPVLVSLVYSGEGVVTVRYLVFRFTFPTEEEKAKEEEPEKPVEGKKAKKKAKYKIPPTEKLLAFAEELTPKLWGQVRKLVKTILVYGLRLNLCVVGVDAADTAIRYGRANAYVYGIITAAQNIIRVKVDTIRIYPDFNGEKGEFTLTLKAMIFPVVLLIVALNIAILALVAALKSGILDVKGKRSVNNGTKAPNQ